MIELSYTPTTFNNGAAPGISADELNKIGNGIKAAHDVLDGATPAASAERLVLRDEDGRAQFAAPASPLDAARKADVDALSTSMAATLADMQRTVSMGGMV